MKITTKTNSRKNRIIDHIQFIHDTVLKNTSDMVSKSAKFTYNRFNYVVTVTGAMLDNNTTVDFQYTLKKDDEIVVEAHTLETFIYEINFEL